MSVRRVVVSLGLALAGAAGAASAAEPPDAWQRAEALVKRSEEAQQRAFDPRFRVKAVRKLAALSAKELEARERGEPGALALGDSGTQLLYTPVPPCRIIDTRAAAGGILTPGTVRDFRVTGTASLASQGGSATGCGVPFGPATAAVINFVSVGPSGPGNLRAWAYATPLPPPPAASILNYTTVPGAVLNLANGIMVPICNPDATTCSNLDLRVRADVNPTQLVADVVGYFERFPTGEVGTAVVWDTDAAATPINDFPGCTHVSGAEVTVDAPVAGRVVVRATVPHRLVQNNGNDRILKLGIAQASDDCSFDNYAGSEVKNDAFVEDFLITVPVMGVFDVAAGSHTFYLNGQMTAGPENSGVVVPGTILEATFYPN